MDYLLSVLVTFGVSALFTAFIIPQIILVSFKRRLFDVVDERKVHKGIVPRLGGVAFVPAVILSLAFIAGNHDLIMAFSPVHMNFDPRLALILCAFTLLYFEGITDDLIGIGYRIKFVFQFVCAAMVVGSGLYVSDFCGVLGIHQIPLWLAYPFSVLLIVFIINAINLIDGIDGLSSGLSMIATLFMGFSFIMTQDFLFALLSFATLGTLASFFVYNVFGKAERKNKIFMGDCGSQCIGLLLSVLAIRLMISEDIDSVGLELSDSLVIVFSVLMIPCLDVIRVMGGRICRHRNPFLPDKSHIHHKFLDLGLSHKKAMFTILLIDLFFVLLNMLLLNLLNINMILLLDIALWGLMIVWLNLVVSAKKEIQKNLF